MKRSSTILITREEQEVPVLKQWCDENNIALEASAFISIRPIKNLHIPKTDWVFFSSPKGLHSYFDQYSVIADKIGVYGKGTLKALLKHGYKADFIGESGLDPHLIGESFNRQLAANETVLFPIGQQSKRSIVHQVSQQNCIELITYSTELIPVESRQQNDILIFTSPSNIDGYLLKNRPANDSTVLAIGPTTAKALHEKMSENKILQASAPTENALIELLKTII